MYNMDDTSHMIVPKTDAPDPRKSAYQQLLPNLTAVPLLIQRDAERQTATSLTGSGKDSSSRLPSSATKVIVPPVTLPVRISSVVLQKWEGFVIAVDAETFTARLTTLTGDEGDQVAEIYNDEIDDEDRALLEPGAVFYWSIGYLDKPSGRERFSQIRMRRLPAWSAAELRAAEKRAKELGDLLDGAMIQ